MKPIFRHWLAQAKLFLPILNSTFRKALLTAPMPLQIFRNFRGSPARGEFTMWYEDQMKYGCKQKHIPYKEMCYLPPHKFRYLTAKLSAKDMSLICLCLIKAVKFKLIKLIKYIQFILL